jgi:hypothetical protein
MKKIEKFINLLQEIIFEMDREMARLDSIWNKDFLGKWGKPEMIALLQQAQNGEINSKYGSGKKQKMLQSTYYIIDKPPINGKNYLEDKILELQELYNKL